MRRFAKAITAGSNVVLATLGSGDAGTYLLNVTNKTASPVKVRIAVTAGAAPVDDDWLEYDATIVGNGVLSRWPLPLDVAWQVYVYANVTGVSAQLIGREKA